MASGFAAGAGADMLQQVLRRKFEEAIAQQKLAEDIRQANMQNQIQQQQLGQGQQRIGLEGERVGIDRQRAGYEGQRVGMEGERLGMEKELQPVRIRNINAQTFDVEGRPAAAELARNFTAGENEKNRSNAVRIANINGSRPRDERLVQVQGPNGTPIWQREGAAVGQPAMQAPRAVTGAERQTLAYFNRMKEALDALEGGGLEDQIAKQGLLGQAQGQLAPNILQSGTQQQYRQAQRAFTEGRLRKESGAAIPTAEYENDARTYFFQPGDSPETTKQKREARKKVLEGLRFSSGRAYQEFYGDDGGSPKANDAAAKAAELIKKYGGK